MASQLPVSDGNFAAWPKHDAPEIEYPFTGDTSHFVLRQRYRGDMANYAAPNISGATHDVFASAYCTGDISLTPVGGGVHEAVREFSTIPNSRTEAEFYPFGFPGLAAVSNLGNAVTISNITGADANTNVLVTTSSNHGFTNANFVTFSWLVAATPGGGIGIYTQGVFMGFPVATTANTAKFPNRTSHPYPGEISFTASSLREISPSRAARTIVVPSYTQFDYYLPGVSPNIATTDDIRLIQEALFLEGTTGEVATEINANTIPSITNWKSNIDTNQYFVGVASILTRYKGNIFQRATRYVKYS